MNRRIASAVLALSFAGISTVMHADEQKTPESTPPTAASQIAPTALTLPSASRGGTTVSMPPTLLVFSDFECPYSAQTYKQIDKLSKTLPASFHVVYKQDPLAIHPGARLDALAALAAGRQKHYAQMAELLFANQGNKSEDALASFARQIGINEAQFRRDLKSPEIRAALDADVAESQALGVDQTPTLFLNGKRLMGLQTEASLTAFTAPSFSSAKPHAGTSLDPALTELLETRTAHAKGLTTAPVTVVEFTDFQCPFCRQAIEPMQKLLADRGRDVRWVFRSFPLNFHPDAEPAAEAAFAAGAQGQFWPMHDLLFAHQTALAPSDLHRYAEQLHLDVAKFDEALQSHRYAGEVAADRALGDKIGVSGTPSFVIDRQMISGVRSLPELEQMVDASLQHAPGKPVRSSTVVAESPVTAPHPVLGASSGAPLVITWFTDVRSPLAARQATLIHMLGDHYDGKVTVLYKAFPLQAHPDGQIAAAALLAAGKQDKFWEMYDALSLERNPIDRPRAISLASKSNLDMNKYLSDLDAGSSAVLADMDEAARRGVMGAPVIFLNDARVDGLQRDSFYTDLADRLIGSSTTASSTGK